MEAFFCPKVSNGWEIERFELRVVRGRNVNPLTPVSDQDRISPYYICTISCRQVMGIKENINYGTTNWSGTKFSKQT